MDHHYYLVIVQMQSSMLESLIFEDGCKELAEMKDWACIEYVFLYEKYKTH